MRRQGCHFLTGGPVFGVHYIYHGSAKAPATAIRVVGTTRESLESRASELLPSGQLAPQVSLCHRWCYHRVKVTSYVLCVFPSRDTQISHSKSRRESRTRFITKKATLPICDFPPYRVDIISEIRRNRVMWQTTSTTESEQGAEHSPLDALIVEQVAKTAVRQRHVLVRLPQAQVKLTPTRLRNLKESRYGAKTLRRGPRRSRRTRNRYEQVTTILTQWLTRPRF